MKSNLLTLKGTYSNPVAAFDTIKKNNIDMIFLDIEMPEMSGLEYLEEIESKYQIIVISGDRKYALETFEYGVSDYLLKPIEYSRFIKSVNKSIDRNYKFEDGLMRDRLFVKIKDHYVRILLKDIVIVDASGQMTSIVTKTKQYKVNHNLIDVDKLVTKPHLVKISENCLVNKLEIVDVCDDKIIFDEKYQLDSVTVNKQIAEELLKQTK